MQSTSQPAAKPYSKQFTTRVVLPMSRRRAISRRDIRGPQRAAQYLLRAETHRLEIFFPFAGAQHNYELRLRPGSTNTGQKVEIRAVSRDAQGYLDPQAWLQRRTDLDHPCASDPELGRYSPSPSWPAEFHGRSSEQRP